MTDVARIGAAAGSGRADVPGAAAATPGSLVTEVSGLPQLVRSLEHDGRSGWKTTEFWVSITTWLLPILTLIWHRDLSSLAVPLAVVAAGAAQAVYTISRAVAKKGHATAIASLAAASPAMLAVAQPAAAPPGAPATGAGSPALAGPPGPAGLTGADGAQLIQAMAAALQAMTAAVEKLSG
ncbi:MAG TPA: hypothetical protein VK586_06725 [Streptosporangiaceae bacterium]|nr:hypothetical protein [Streptosporangiaceae bacterium]